MNHHQVDKGGEYGEQRHGISTANSRFFLFTIFFIFFLFAEIITNFEKFCDLKRKIIQ